MSEADRASDLTGVWSGEYWYGNGRNPTKFVATITDDIGGLAGTTLERAPGWLNTPELSATLSGRRAESAVSFTKLYDQAGRLGLAPIAYTGTADAALSVVEGQWRLIQGQLLTGGFIMRRASSTKIEAKREAELVTSAPAGRRKQVAVVPGKRRPLKPE